jgi:hypothetical protein
MDPVLGQSSSAKSFRELFKKPWIALARIIIVDGNEGFKRSPKSAATAVYNCL